MDDLLAILNIVEGRGTILREERDLLMTEYTDVWTIFHEVIGEPFLSPGKIPVSQEQLTEIRARIAKQNEAALAVKSLRADIIKQFKAFRAWFRFLTA